MTYEILDNIGNPVNSPANSLNLGSSISFLAGPSDGSGDSHDYPSISTEGSLSCSTTGCGAVKLSVAFTGSGEGDQYNLISRSQVNVNSVPEPSTTLGLIAFGIGSLVVKRRKAQK
jgi:hypothetical protein